MSKKGNNKEVPSKTSSHLIDLVDDIRAPYAHPIQTAQMRQLWANMGQPRRERLRADLQLRDRAVEHMDEPEKCE